MSVKCLKILVLLSLIPLALRATSLLGHVMPSPSESEQSTSSVAVAATAATGVSVSGSVHRGFNQRHRRRMESTLAAFGTTRFGRGGGDGGLGDEKRLAPTGSNPLHNLR